MNNLKEFKELIERYESITIEEISKVIRIDHPSDAKQKLTGFGSSLSCTLCQSAIDKNDNVICDSCFWIKETCSLCNRGKNKDSYDEIDISECSFSIHNAFKARAKYMRSILKDN